MNLRRLVLVRFMSHDDTEIVFPDRGVMLITGPNGAGKSSVPEAVGYAGWGKTMRGDPPWRGDAKEGMEVRLESDVACITRTRKGAKTELQWGKLNTHNEVDYPTNSKSQDPLEREIGTFGLWRKSRVFSSSDAAHFSLATDKERKLLIEAFLGNDRFDTALKRCQKDLREAYLAHQAKDRDVTVMDTKLKAAKAHLKELEALGALDSRVPERPPKPDRKKLAELDEQITETDDKLDKLRRSLRSNDSNQAELTAELRVIERTLERLKGDTCPTCTQVIPKKLVSQLKHEAHDKESLIEAERAKAAEALRPIERKIAKAEAAMREVRKQRAALAADITNAEQAVRAWERAKAAVDEHNASIERARATITDLEPKLLDAEEDRDTLAVDVAELSEVENVLGLKGVRAHILAKSLRGIEAMSNAWMARLSPTARLTLSPYTDSGDEKISLQVTGYGRGLGRGTHSSTSAGERKRTDISLLLGLGEVSAAAHGQEVGTLWFDEVMDSLDRQGIEAMTEAFRELAESRCVVVISHNEDMIRGLRGIAVSHLRIANGKVSDA